MSTDCRQTNVRAGEEKLNYTCLRPGPLLPTYTYTQAHDAHAPNKPPVRPSSQASSHVDSARRAASQTDRGTAALACRRQSVTRTRTYLLVVTAVARSSTHHSTSKHDARWTPEGALLARPASVTTTVRYRNPIPLPAEPCPDRRRRHPPDLDEYFCTCLTACTRGTRPWQVPSSLSQLIR